LFSNAFFQAQNAPKSTEAVASPQSPHWRSLQCSPDPLVGFRGRAQKGWGKGCERKGKRGRGEEGGTGDLLHGLRGDRSLTVFR